MGEKTDQGQSGGVNISGGRVDVGGDIVGRDKIVGGVSIRGAAGVIADSITGRDHIANTVNVNTGRTHEIIISILEGEIENKNRELNELRSKNQRLLEDLSLKSEELMACHTLFSMARLFIGWHDSNLKNYISFSCMFISEKKLSVEFLHFVSSRAISVRNNDD